MTKKQKTWKAARFLALGCFLSVTSVSQSFASCNEGSWKPLANSCTKEGKTTLVKDAKAHCKAKIQAPAGYFFFKKDVELLFTSNYEGLPKNGAKKPIGKQKVYFASLKKLPSKYKNNPLITGAGILSSATAEGYCRRAKGRRLGKTCYAKALIKAKAYPLSCLSKWLGS